jgi:putative transposase
MQQLEPLEFMECLAALVPRPHFHLIRFHGVLAPNAKLRSKIVPAPAEPAFEPPTDHARARGETPRMSWARLLKRVFDIDIEHCPNCGGALKIIAALRHAVQDGHRRFAGDCQNPQSSGPIDPRPVACAGASSRIIPDNLTAENRLPTQADGAARSAFERAAP